MYDDNGDEVGMDVVGGDVVGYDDDGTPIVVTGRRRARTMRLQPKPGWRQTQLAPVAAHRNERKHVRCEQRKHHFRGAAPKALPW